MKKTMIFLVILIMIFTFSACSSKDQPKTLISNQFDEYIDHDIVEEKDFNDFINSVSNYTIPGVVVVKTTIRNNFNIIVEEREATGFIYAIYDKSLRVVTSLDAVKSDNETYHVQVEIVDFTNRLYPGLIISKSEEYQISVIKFDTNSSVSKLRKIGFSSYVPMNNEPVLMLSNYDKSRNSLIMGTILSIDSTTGLIQTTLPVDNHIIGGTIINLRNEIVGMVISVNENSAMILSVEKLKTYFSTV